jgi:hypothetical protein
MVKWVILIKKLNGISYLLNTYFTMSSIALSDILDRMKIRINNRKAGTNASRKGMFVDMFDDGSLEQYIKDNTKDPWKGTPFEGYVSMSPKQKGEFGERFVSKVFDGRGHKVERAHSSTAGYDRLINGMKVEIKFSLAQRAPVAGVKKDIFMINHVSKAKDWERLLFCGINQEENDIRILWFTNKDFTSYIAGGGSLFNIQQGGKKVKNDDYMCCKIIDLMGCDWVNEGLSAW